MPCHCAMISKLITVTTNQEIGEVLTVLEKNKIDAVPVLSESGSVEGVFSVQLLLKNLLPVSVTTGDGMGADVKIGAAPGVAKRLRHVKNIPVSELMDKNLNIVAPETPIWEGVNMLVHQGAPLLVVESATGKLIGMITEQSLIDDMERAQE